MNKLKEKQLTVVVSCMDTRLNDLIEKRYGDKNTVMFRTAGANVISIMDTITEMVSSGKVKEVVIAPHTDCGMLKYAYSVLHGETTPNERTSKLIAPFKGMSVSSRSEMEARNGGIQKDLLSHNLKGLRVSIASELIDLSHLTFPAFEHSRASLIITEASSRPYNEILYRSGTGMSNSYILQGDITPHSVKEFLPDINIAVSVLGIRDIRFDVPGLSATNANAVIKEVRNANLSPEIKLRLIHSKR